MTKYIQIDEEGYFSINGVRVSDNNYGRFLSSELKLTDKKTLTTTASPTSSESVGVEAFNEALVVQKIEKTDLEEWLCTNPHGFSTKFNLNTLCVDEWDRFHGLTSESIPFVLSRSAQTDFFNLIDDFDDDSFTVNKVTYNTEDYFIQNQNSSTTKFWSQIYESEDTPGWELQKVSPILVDALPQLKIPKSRIALLGCGSGEDAAYLAELGHLVTAFDISYEAIEKAKARHSHIKGLSFIKADAFNLPDQYISEFDIIFENKFYCAVNPSDRNKVVRTWCRLLAPDGMLLGQFFCMPKRVGPPYGGSEWEIRKRLEKDFHFLYWTRAKNSAERWQGKELLVYAKKRRGD